MSLRGQLLTLGRYDRHRVRVAWHRMVGLVRERCTEARCELWTPYGLLSMQQLVTLVERSVCAQALTVRAGSDMCIGVYHHAVPAQVSRTSTRVVPAVLENTGRTRASVAQARGES